jgi:hypothetical protein
MSKNTERGPRDVNDISWAIGKFLFCCIIPFFITNNCLCIDDKANCLNQEKQQGEHLRGMRMRVRTAGKRRTSKTVTTKA